MDKCPCGREVVTFRFVEDGSDRLIFMPLSEPVAYEPATGVVSAPPDVERNWHGAPISPLASCPEGLASGGLQFSSSPRAADSTSHPFRSLGEWIASKIFRRGRIAAFSPDATRRPLE